MTIFKAYITAFLLMTTLISITACSGGEADYSLDQIEGVNKIVFMSRANVIVEKTANPIAELEVKSSSPVRLSIISGNDIFDIDTDHNYIVYAEGITENNITVGIDYTVIVQAVDSYGKTANQIVTIEFVDDINTVQPQIDPTYNMTPFVVQGDTDPFVQLEVYNPRDNGVLYALSGADSDKFNISDDGALSLKSNVPTGDYEVVVVVKDSENTTLQSQTNQITVTVVASEADLKPTIISEHFDYAENSSDPIEVVTQSNIPDTLRYSLSGTDSFYLKIDPVTGVISFDVYYGFPNYEYPEDSNGDNTYEADVTVTDGNGHSDSKAITITILDVDDAPTGIVFESSGTTSISVQDGSFLTKYYDQQITAVASPTNGDLTYSIEGFDNEDSQVTFNLSQDGNLNITVKNTDPSQIKVYVKVEEARGEVNYQTLFVNITE